MIDQDDLEENPSKYLLSSENFDEDGDLRTVDPETQARLQALLEAAGKMFPLPLGYGRAQS